MRDKVLELFNIEKKEALPVTLLLIQSFFIGGFIGAFEISSYSLFLGIFPKEYIAKAYVVSGVVGILITASYSKLQSRKLFSHLSIINALFIIATVVLLRIGFSLENMNKVVIFFVFVLFGPLRIIAVVAFWGTVVRLFSLRQGKRLFGIIDAGQIVGNIVCSLIIPVLLNFFLTTIDILWISAGSILIAMLIQMYIVRRFDVDEKSDQHDDEEVAVSKSLPFKELLKIKYVRVMSIFVVLSMASAFFIHFSFMMVAKDKYPIETELTKFFAFFNGTVMFFSLIIKTFVYSKLLKTYGLKISLTLSPFLLGIFTLGTVLIGSFFGYLPDSDGFILFFMIIVLNRLFSVALKDSFEAPSFKVLYQSLEKAIRYDVQAKIDGTVNEFAALGTGIFLMLLGFLPFFKTLHYSYVLLGIVLIWVVVSFDTYKEYKNSLKQSLAKFQKLFKSRETGKRDVDIIVISAKDIVDELRLLYIIDPRKMIRELVKAYNSGDNTVKLELQKFQDDYIVLYPGRRSVLQEEAVVNCDWVKEEYNNFNNKVKNLINSNQDLEKFVYSNDSKDRLFAARYIEIRGGKNYNNLLIHLVRDVEINVKKAALVASSFVDPYEFAPICLDFLMSQSSIGHAREALIEMGDEALEYLEQAYYKTEATTQFLVRVTSVMGEIGGVTANRYLVNKLNDHHKIITEIVIKSLSEIGFKADDTYLPKVIQAIRNKIGVTAWNISAKYIVDEYQLDGRLSKELEIEIESNYYSIFNMLSLCYDPESIIQIRKNLNSGTNEGVGFAIELLDLFLAEELKAVLFPLLDDISAMEKIKRLQNYYPIDFYYPEELLLAIINRDNNAIGEAVKIRAMEIFGDNSSYLISEDIIAQIFNSDKLMYETAGYIIHSKDPIIYEECSSRIPLANKIHLDRLNLSKNEKEKHLTIEKLNVLKDSIFKKLSFENVAQIARVAYDISFDRLFEITESKDNSKDVYILVKGIIEIGDESFTSENTCQVIDGGLFCKKCIIKASDDLLMYRIKKQSLIELVFEHADIYTEVKELIISQ